MNGGRAAEHVAFDVSTRRQGREQAFIDSADRRCKVFLEYPVELEFLPRRDAQGSIADGAGELVAGQELAGRQLSPHDPDADHELVGLVFSLAFQLGAHVAVVLLVRTMELEDRARLFTEVVKRI